VSTTNNKQTTTTTKTVKEVKGEKSLAEKKGEKLFSLIFVPPSWPLYLHCN
jgi:hypothetical protein